MTALGQLGSEKYVLLTTFRKTGKAVPTPVWAVPDGDGLAVWTTNDAGKLKRIRNSPRVTVAPCDVRGNPKGDEVEAAARIGDDADRARVREALKRKYGLAGRLVLLGSRLRRGADGTTTIHVS
ncbi:PPOX class F420-dependent oxidoreductase [Couchioplanes caeruleus]|uniref:PPOX class F420-dependent oxidoreductase n=1 Tax=Couchioplanes caeruleus TaxID=56438 RepID=UPI0020BFB530|nr:PPOX class F420-dependent oxidoreductase [Couchioplanes caeruleus]UQU64826.1 PPOX class F420-dependent oxidoreductase [Couchioplanes caeruleus]